MMRAKKGKIGIYIHIPFCEKKCDYCDFTSYGNKIEYADRYIEYMRKEIEMYRKDISKRGVETIFIGGGTPSLIDSKYIKYILEDIYKIENVVKKDIKEVTIEGNPNSYCYEKLVEYREAGINRISMGVQSFNDKELRNIGRVHSSEEIYSAVENIRRAGFKNLSLDIMFGLPSQTLQSSLNNLKEAIKLRVEHISYYGLILEEGTKLYKKVSEGKLDIPDEDLERTMYHDGIEYLEENGYSRYEISNFSKKGYESIHNISYWKIEEYIGIGLSASSYLHGKRYNNVSEFSEYYNALDSGKKAIENSTIEDIDSDEEIIEYLIMGLRLTDGIDKREYRKRFNSGISKRHIEVFEKYKKENKIKEDERNIKLTDSGIDISNQIFIEILK